MVRPNRVPCQERFLCIPHCPITRKKNGVKQTPAAECRERGLRDGACQAVTQGSGQQYLSAFALILQASPFQLSVLSALPHLIGTGAQLVSVKLLQWFPNRKALIFSGTVGQAFVWIPIVLLPVVSP